MGPSAGLRRARRAGAPATVGRAVLRTVRDLLVRLPTVALVHAAGLALLVGSPWVGLGFWTAKSAVDMAYTVRVGRAYQLFSGGQRCRSTDLICLAVLHPVFIATTLLLMPFQTARWKGRPAT